MPRTIFVRSAILVVIPLLQFVLCVLINREFNTILSKLYCPAQPPPDPPVVAVVEPLPSQAIAVQSQSVPIAMRANSEQNNGNTATVTQLQLGAPSEML